MIGEFFCDTASEASEVVALISGTKKIEKREVVKSTKATSTRKRRSTSKFGLWESDEVRLLLENKGNPSSVVTRDPALRERHTPGAISNALSAVRNGHYFSPRFKSLVVAEMSKMKSAPVEA